jgi:NhaA family Na+:H+ antiporter
MDQRRVDDVVFFLVALELKRELVLGELNNPRTAALSIAAALGGMLVPAGFYLVLQFEQPGEHGWGTVMATDTAFVIGCLALLGRRIPQSLRVFMLSLAIVDDIGAILVVAIGYSSHIAWGALAMGACGVAFVFGMASFGVRSMAIYFLVGGLIWLAVDASGIHATVTGVIIGLLTPTRRWVSDERLHAILDRVVAYPAGDHWSGDTEDRKALRLAEIAARETLSPVERLEMMLHPWVGFVIMPLFAFANAGMPIAFVDLGNPVTGAVFVGFALGKPVGVLTFSWLAVRTGIAMPVRESELGLLGGRWPARRYRLHHGSVHCQSGFRPKPHQRCQIGYLVSLGGLCHGGYHIVGLVVSAWHAFSAGSKLTRPHLRIWRILHAMAAAARMHAIYGESNRGKQNQSMDPSRVTSANVG